MWIPHVRRWSALGDGGSDLLPSGGLAKASGSELMRVKMAVAKKVMEAILPFAICY